MTSPIAHAITRPGKEPLLFKDKTKAETMRASLNDATAETVDLVAYQPVPENAFAKLFSTTHGQIVVIRQDGDEGPEVRLYTQPDGLGVCSCAIKFQDTEAGQDGADATFAKIDEHAAIACTKDLRKWAGEITGEGN